MDKYTIMREFADSWFLILMVTFFVAVVFWAFRPGGRKQQKDASDIPFRHENKPACDDTPPVSAEKTDKEARK